MKHDPFHGFFSDPYKTSLKKAVMMNLTLSHLRSKEFQKLHLLCKPQHRETSKCTFRCIQGKVVALQKEQATSSQQAKP